MNNEEVFGMTKCSNLMKNSDEGVHILLSFVTPKRSINRTEPAERQLLIDDVSFRIPPPTSPFEIQHRKLTYSYRNLNRQTRILRRLTASLRALRIYNFPPLSLPGAGVFKAYLVKTLVHHTVSTIHRTRYLRSSDFSVVLSKVTYQFSILVPVAETPTYCSTGWLLLPPPIPEVFSNETYLHTAMLRGTTHSRLSLTPADSSMSLESDSCSSQASTPFDAIVLSLSTPASLKAGLKPQYGTVPLFWFPSSHATYLAKLIYIQFTVTPTIFIADAFLTTITGISIHDLYTNHSGIRVGVILLPCSSNNERVWSSLRKQEKDRSSHPVEINSKTVYAVLRLPNELEACRLSRYELEMMDGFQMAFSSEHEFTQCWKETHANMNISLPYTSIRILRTRRNDIAIASTETILPPSGTLRDKTGKISAEMIPLICRLRQLAQPTIATLGTHFPTLSPAPGVKPEVQG
ncbi:uncharacterized protein BDR25DRAFT_360818 [Lindgomyces ingoldianus]|uniref:Uncharacterized protein n=1 Tax=Lindgomyces ingoldianus TaxID=673940 RepID=A0ACB6QFC0_9PLEO|nr:uncharacterized protein BDR25DRAFT_360818 [Lindgomyces ingoldianus]KAF2465190.1 hypothetical protein BDR25DRAFT_360818 [Lindgomyces ingoldianus]